MDGSVSNSIEGNKRKPGSSILYPNPAENIIDLELSGPCLIEIVNLQGTLMKSINIKNNKAEINIAELAKGMYLLIVKTQDNIEVLKFIKE